MPDRLKGNWRSWSLFYRRDEKADPTEPPWEGDSTSVKCHLPAE